MEDCKSKWIERNKLAIKLFKTISTASTDHFNDVLKCWGITCLWRLLGKYSSSGQMICEPWVDVGLCGITGVNWQHERYYCHYCSIQTAESYFTFCRETLLQYRDCRILLHSLKRHYCSIKTAESCFFTFCRDTMNADVPFLSELI